MDVAGDDGEDVEETVDGKSHVRPADDEEGERGEEDVEDGEAETVAEVAHFGEDGLCSGMEKKGKGRRMRKRWRKRMSSGGHDGG